MDGYGPIDNHCLERSSMQSTKYIATPDHSENMENAIMMVCEKEHHQLVKLNHGMFIIRFSFILMMNRYTLSDTWV